MIALTTPITGGAQTGFTSPTYTIAADQAVDTNGKQWAVTALGGTQVNVRSHSSSDPFTLLFVRPKAFKALGKVHPVSGVLASVPMNTFLLKIQKGVIPLAAQPVKTATVRCIFEIPAGADTADPANIRAMISLLVGAVSQLSAGLGDTVISGLVG